MPRIADHTVLTSSNATELETTLNELHQASWKVDLEVNVEKTKILSSIDRNIRFEKETIEIVGEYIYLG